jgi:hypothetical protein
MSPTKVGFATIAQLFCYDISGEVFGKVYGEISVDVSDEIVFCYNITVFFATRYPARSPADSAFSFYFMGKPFFATCGCCRGVIFTLGGILLLHANITVHDVDPTTGDPGLRNQMPGAPTLSFFYPFSVLSKVIPFL